LAIPAKPDLYLFYFGIKMKNYLIILSCLVFFLFSLQGFSRNNRNPGYSDPVLTALNQDQPQDQHKRSNRKGGKTETGETGNPGMLIEAKKEALIGNIEGATTMFRRYIERYPGDAVGYYELARLEIDRKNLRDALDLAQKAQALDTANIWYMLFLSELCQSSAQYDESIRMMEMVIRKDPDNLDYRYQLASLYLQVRKYQDAIAVYNIIEEKAGISEEISLQKEKIYLFLVDLPKAEAELKKLIGAFPGESQYYSILAEFYMSNNQPGKAVETYRMIEEIDPENAYIHMSLADYYRKTGDKEKAFQELKLGFANPNLDIDTKVNILLSFYSVNQIYNDLKDQAFELSKILVEVHPSDPKAHSIMGDFYLQAKRYAEARESFLKVMTLDSSKYVIYEEIMRLDIQLGEFPHLLEFSRKAIALFPEQPLPYLFSGIGNYQLKNYSDALSAFNDGIKLVADNNELLAQFYMYMGDTWHALKNDKEAYQVYDKSLQINPANAYVLNNYAYYLSLKGEELGKAESMARKAVNLDPANSSFQDTYGWVLYKQGKYREAKEWIGKAIEDKEGASSEVLEHYGDVLFKLGEPFQAVDYWIRAKKKGEASGLIDKKIEEKKLIE
jgi:tetratricopeptide (TPR) repeat protein